MRWSGFRQRDNHASHVIGVAELIDAKSITLPGYTLQIEVKAPIDSERCLYLFSIMHLVKGRRIRVYQLEVVPANKRSHNGLTTIYGPHEHLGEEEPTPVACSDVNCDNWDASLRWFFNRVSVAPFDVENPNKPC